MKRHESIRARDLRDGDVVWVAADTYARVSVHQSEPDQVVTVSYVLPDLVTGGARMTATYPTDRQVQILVRAADPRFTTEGEHSVGVPWRFSESGAKGTA